jgi:hypothetical protein
MDGGQKGRNVFRYISAIGNENILWRHVLALEEDIKVKKEYTVSDLTTAPHFAAWIRMITEYICNSLFHAYFQMTLDQKVYDDKFDDIVEKIKTVHMENPSYLGASHNALDNMVVLIKVFVDLRHCFQHGGLPNISRTLKYTTADRIDYLLDPRNFDEIRKIFMDALAFTSSLPRQSVSL